MTASVTFADGQLLLNGVVDYDNAASVCKAGQKLLTQAGQTVTVNVAQLQSDSSVTAAVLVQWARQAAQAGQAFGLLNVPEQLAAIIRVSGLEQALGLSASTTTSVESV